MKKVTIVGAILDLILSILKITAGNLGGSSALIADGVHSLSDLVSDGIVLYATKFSAEDPDDDHPYGHERFETIATLFLGVILLLVGFGIIYDALSNIMDPADLTNVTLLITVGVISMLSKEALYWATIRVAKKYNSKMIEANAWHHRSDAISSVVVVIGIIGAITGYPNLDLIAAIIVGSMIIKMAIGFTIQSSKELVDTSIDKSDLDRLKKKMLEISGVTDVHSLRTRKYAGNIHGDVHVEVEPFLSVSEGHLIGILVEGRAKECLNDLADITVHIDPEKNDHLVAYKELLPREKAIAIINKLTNNHPIHDYIMEKRLHYLSGIIHIDFIVDGRSLDSSLTMKDIECFLHGVLSDNNRFGIVRVYYLNQQEI